METSQQLQFVFERLEDLARAIEAAMRNPDAPWVPFKNRKNPKGIEHDVKKST